MAPSIERGTLDKGKNVSGSEFRPEKELDGKRGFSKKVDGIHALI